MRAKLIQQAYTIIVSIAAGLTLAPAMLFAEMERRIVLNPISMARHENISIADLLPPDAPEEVRARAMTVSLGDAPLPGSHRNFARAQVERVLNGVPQLRDALEIPPSIEVTRWSRRLTREEVLIAIAEALRSNKMPVPSLLLSRDLVLNFDVAVTEDAPKLRVTRIEPSPDGAETHVRLWTSSEPRTPPFWVTLLLNIESDKSTDARNPETVEANERANPLPISQKDSHSLSGTGEMHTTSGPRDFRYNTFRSISPSKNTLRPSVLVRTGDRVQVNLQAEGMRLSAKAIALENGSLGQKIRVRNSDTGKVLNGTVVAAHAIEADF